jgi:hypothetical protein
MWKPKGGKKHGRRQSGLHRGHAISILISITLYRNDRQNLAIFVGLWAPTILNLGQTLVDDDPS